MTYIESAWARKLDCVVVYLAVLALLSSRGRAIELEAAAQSIEVSGTEFVVKNVDGRILRSSQLVGAILNVSTPDGKLRLRIDSVEPDPGDEKLSALPSTKVWLHTFSYQSPEGDWRNFCKAGPDGRQQGFPLAGRSKLDGSLEPTASGVFEISCTSGAQGKCVRFGYRPWETLPDGSSMLNIFNTCVRLVRADYSGEGRPTTKDGRTIDVYDFLGIQSKAGDPSHEFEAGWTPDGAVCVKHVRVAENTSLQVLETSVPRLQGRTGATCTEEFARAHGALLFNRSPP